MTSSPKSHQAPKSPRSLPTASGDAAPRSVRADDLRHCETEAIHQPETIQAYGGLVVCEVSTCTPIVQPTCATTGGCGATQSNATQAAPANALFCYAGDGEPQTAETGNKFCWALGPDGWRDCGVVEVDVSSAGKPRHGLN